MLKLKTREGFSIARASRASENIWLECPSTVFKEGSKCICLQCHVMSRRKSSNSNLFLTASTTTITARLRAWALQGNCDSIPLVCRLKCWSSRMFWGLTKASKGPASWCQLAQESQERVRTMKTRRRYLGRTVKLDELQVLISQVRLPARKVLIWDLSL